MLAELRADVRRYTSLVKEPVPKLRLVRSLLETQGIWALTMYRFGRWANLAAPRPLRKPAKAAYLVGFKLVEILTGISIPAQADIGPGLYIGHFGNIIVHPDTVMGARCALSQGVTIGVLGGARPGVPRFGDDVYIGAGAKVLGRVTVGDGATIGANAVVVHDIPAGATAVGVPARPVVRNKPKAGDDGVRAAG